MRSEEKLKNLCYRDYSSLVILNNIDGISVYDMLKRKEKHFLFLTVASLKKFTYWPIINFRILESIK